jgi:uncharacterized protein YkwD
MGSIGKRSSTTAWGHFHDRASLPIYDWMGLRGRLAVAIVPLLAGCGWFAGGASGREAAPAAHASVRTSSSVEASIRSCANRERRERGLGSLDHDHTLDRAARLHAKRMLEQGFFDHVDPAGNGPADRVRRFAKRRYAIVGENIAAGYESARATCRDWMKSPGHRENILRSSFTRIGTGYASGGGPYGRYYVQVFADLAG